MNIIEVKTNSYYRSIPLQGWDSLSAALNLYAQGETKASLATRLRLVEDMDAAYGSGALDLMAEMKKIQGPPDLFVTRLLTEARQRLNERDSWHGSYEYEAMGTPFFKASIDIELLDRSHEVYGLGISAAYVGDKPEEELAALLNIPRTLVRSTVIATTDPEPNDRFAFDFEQILRKLDDVLETKHLTGTFLATEMMKGDQYSEPPSLLLFRDTGIQIVITLGNVERRFNHRHSARPHDTWSLNGSVVSGFLKESYSIPGTLELPTFTVTITSSRGEKYTRKPFWEDSTKASVLRLTERLADALRS